ncbi:MAG: hypothetical protein GWP15_02315, partial [Nitrospirae bacterium]|nr:hypothetical protein [Nitrospirota bacterium]
MHNTSSGSQPAPKKLRESVLKDEKIGANKALKSRERKSKEQVIEKKTQKELSDMKEIRDFWEETFGKGAIASFFISLNAFLAGEEGTFDAAAFDEEISARAKELSKQG